MRYTVRPISDRTWLRPSGQRKASQFDSTWTKTLTLLSREVDALGGRDVVIEIDVREQDIKLDGMLRANARSESPAVVVAFESKHGPMLYRCDRFVSRWYEQGPDWQQNVRAIAKSLERLRLVDDYGVTDTGQQYAGFKALPAGRAMPASHMTSRDAEEILGRWSGETAWLTEDTPAVHRKARANAHPDRNTGDRTAWDQVEQAAAVLGANR